MATSLQTYGGRWVQVDVSGPISGVGRVVPRLTVPVAFTAPDAVELRLDHVVVRLMAAGELMGTGQLAGNLLAQGRSYKPIAMVEIVTSHRLLDWVTEGLGRASAAPFTLEPYGVVSYRRDDAASFEQDTLSEQQAGHQFGIARSDWFTGVLGPVQQAEFIYLEVAVPSGHFTEKWQAALELLRNAEAAWAAGDDASVFVHLRGALDSLPGAKQSIFDSVTNETKRTVLDALTREYGKLLHFGRHVDPPGGADAGRFPVTHRDAGFAIAQMKLLLSYVSRLVAAHE
jgi:hypothetical protein